MSSVEHSFGGSWTEDKLERLRKYLSAYTIIFDRNTRAQFLTTHYVDAFAGTGSRTSTDIDLRRTYSLFDEEEALEVETFYNGSARIALEIVPQFDYYRFIEKDATYVEQLALLTNQYPCMLDKVHIVHGDANSQIAAWCSQMDWGRNRAVVFLDPYGMSVDWSTISLLGESGGVDLWVLLPIGQAINRLLTRQGPPPKAWSNSLTRFFGTEDWRDAFYRESLQPSLYNGSTTFEKHANFASIASYFYERLQTVFPFVADNYRMLVNSRNNPIFGLYFAGSNRTGVRIANDILRG